MSKKKNTLTDKSKNEFLIDSLLKTREANINEEVEDILYLFSTYIASNSSFKYNRTYLTDEISEFKLNIKIFNQKIDFFKKMTNRLLSSKDDIENISVHFDGIYKFKLIHPIKSELNNDEISQFQFDKIGRDFIIVKFIFSDTNGNIEYSHKIKNFSHSRQKELHNEVLDHFTQFKKNIKRIHNEG